MYYNISIKRTAITLIVQHQIDCAFMWILSVSVIYYLPDSFQNYRTILMIIIWYNFDAENVLIRLLHGADILYVEIETADPTSKTGSSAAVNTEREDTHFNW